MLKKIQQAFALTEPGARSLVKSTLLTALANLTLMFPVGLIVIVLKQLTGPAPVTMAEILLYTISGIALALLIYLVHYFQYTSLYIATYSESANLRIQLAEKLRKLPLAFFGKRDIADLTNTLISDCAFLEQAFSHYIPQLFGSLLSITLVAIGMFCLDWRMALAVLWVLPVSSLLAIGSKMWQDKFTKRSLLAKQQVANSIQECLETIRELKANNLQESYLEQFDAKLRTAERAAIHSEWMTGSFISGAQAFLRLGLASTVLVGGALLLKGETDFPTYFVFLLAASRLYDPLAVLFMHIGALFLTRLRIDRMKELENQPEQCGANECRPDSFDIEFRNVSFSYHDGDQVIDRISFTAKQGEVTALVGPSGCGKSTVTKLAARFWDAGSGTITLGGIDISTVNPEALLANYAVVFQDVMLFHESVMENIRLGRRGASDHEVFAAAKAAQCEEFIQRLPQGYQTVIGENGATLSGGERQRLSIARALLKNAPVILLDEATASLDAESESKVQQALGVLVREKTVLVIAHRLRTIAGADKVVVLNNGRVEESGTPADLMTKNGTYRQLMQLQT